LPGGEKQESDKPGKQQDHSLAPSPWLYKYKVKIQHEADLAPGFFLCRPLHATKVLPGTEKVCEKVSMIPADKVSAPSSQGIKAETPPPQQLSF